MHSKKENPRENVMRKLLVLIATIALFALPVTALADTFTFSTTATAPNNNGATDNTNESDYQGGSLQFDLDHHRAYTWQLSGINIPQGQVITGATITFNNIANWDTNSNMLFVHLLDTARTFASSTSSRSATVNGVTYYEDATGVPVTTISDYFAGDDSALVLAGTGDTLIGSEDFNMVGQNGYMAAHFTFTFNASQLAALAAYIANGNNLAFGFDPDCHYWNNGIVFKIYTGPQTIPEPASLALLGTGLVSTGFYLRKRRQARKLSK
jgi:hypothetical protein